MTLQTNLDKIRFLVSHAKQDINLCVAAYQIIQKASVDERSVLMEEYIRGFKKTKTDESFEIPIVFNDEMLRIYVRQYHRIVIGRLEELLNGVYSKEDFYSKLTDYIMTNDNLKNDGARAFAILACCLDARLPYACVDLSVGLKMDNEEYSRIINQLEDKIERIHYILNAIIHQRTEQASILLKELDSIEDTKQRTVLFVTILSLTESKAIEKTLLKMKLASDPDLMDD